MGREMLTLFSFSSTSRSIEAIQPGPLFGACDRHYSLGMEGGVLCVFSVT